MKLDSENYAVHYPAIEAEVLDSTDNSLFNDVLRSMMNDRRFSRDDIGYLVLAMDRHVGKYGHWCDFTYTDQNAAGRFLDTVARSDRPEVGTKLIAFLQDAFPYAPPEPQDRRTALKIMGGVLGAILSGGVADQAMGYKLEDDRGIFDSTAAITGGAAGAGIGHARGKKQLEEAMSPRDRLMRNLIIHANHQHEVGRQ